MLTAREGYRRTVNSSVSLWYTCIKYVKELNLFDKDVIELSLCQKWTLIELFVHRNNTEIFLGGGVVVWTWEYQLGNSKSESQPICSSLGEQDYVVNLCLWDTLARLVKVCSSQEEQQHHNQKEIWELFYFCLLHHFLIDFDLLGNWEERNRSWKEFTT